MAAAGCDVERLSGAGDLEMLLGCLEICHVFQDVSLAVMPALPCELLLGGALNWVEVHETTGELICALAKAGRQSRKSKPAARAAILPFWHLAWVGRVAPSRAYCRL